MKRHGALSSVADDAADRPPSKAAAATVGTTVFSMTAVVGTPPDCGKSNSYPAAVGHWLQSVINYLREIVLQDFSPMP
jgi:hypothetical protein